MKNSIMKHALFILLMIGVSLFSYAHASELQTPSTAVQPTPGPAVQNDKSPENARPKIGLVLAGGGARGLAHIGVIKALEARHIPIDYIAGTSMGALIGGLYAAGLPIDQIEQFVTRVDWEQTFNDDPKRYYQSFRRKQQQFGYYIKGEVGMHDWTFRLPNGLIQGQKQDVLLESLLLNAAPSENFDKLPIPFRAVATDIATGQSVVLKEGNLSQALRASMSVPGIFAPVKIGKHLLVDGGITDNTPIDVVRKMGADIVIVSDIHDERAQRDKLKSFVDITNQLITGLTLNNSLQQLSTLTKKDVLICPDLTGFTSTDFDKSTLFIERGEQAATAHEDALKKLALPEPYSPPNEHRSHSLLVKTIELDNQTGIANGVILHYIHQKIDQPLDRTRLETDLSYLYGLGFFKNVSYDFINHKGQGKLVIHTTEPEWGPNFFKLKFNLASNLGDDTQFNLGFRHTYQPVNDMGAEWRNELQIGEIQHVRTEFYQPITQGQSLYVKPFADYHEENYLYNNAAFGTFSIALDKKRVQTGLELGVNLTTNNRLFTQYYYESGELVIGHKTSKEISDKYHQTVTTVGLEHDTLDQVAFPTSGSLLYYGFSGISSKYEPSLESHTDVFKLSSYRSFHRHTFNFYAEYTDMNGPIGFESSQFYTLGGFQRLSGFRQNELIGNQIVFTRLKYLYRLLGESNSVFHFPLYLGATLEAGNVFGSYTSPEKIDLDKTKQAGSVFLGMNTPLGPAYLAYGYHNSSKQSVYFYFGKSFD